MIRQIDHIKPVKTAKTLALTTYLFALLYFPTDMALADEKVDVGIGLWLTLLLPLIYAAGLFVCVFMFCWIYNQVARHVGGIELQLRKSGDSVETAE